MGSKVGDLVRLIDKVFPPLPCIVVQENANGTRNLTYADPDPLNVDGNGNRNMIIEKGVPEIAVISSSPAKSFFPL